MRALLIFLLLGVQLAAAQPSSGPADASQLLAEGRCAEAQTLVESQPASVALYYLGACYEAKGEKTLAAVAYQRYIAHAGDTPEAREARLRLAELPSTSPPAPGSRPSAVPASDDEVPKRPPPANPDPPGWSRAGPAAIGVGGVSVLMGLMFRAIANDRADSLNGVGITPEQFRELSQERDRFRIASFSALGLGGALIAGGIGVVVAAKRATPAVQATLSPRGLGLAVSF